MNKKVYLTNAFSLGMLSGSQQYLIEVREITLEEVKTLINDGFISAVGHEPTAQLLSEMLGISVSSNRIQVKLEKGDVLVIYQLLQRLPEGKVLSKEEILQLPHKWFKLTLF